MTASRTPPLNEHDIQRYWSKVQKAGPDDCWIWIGTRHRTGYGIFTVRKKMYGPHRIALILDGRPQPPPPHQFALHGDCSNRLCVNPAHLRWGSNAENMADMVRLGRSLKGERGKKAVLTERDVRAIRASSLQLVDLAKMYGVQKAAIWKVRQRVTWRHVH